MISRTLNFLISQLLRFTTCRTLSNNRKIFQMVFDCELWLLLASHKIKILHIQFFIVMAINTKKIPNFLENLNIQSYVQLVYSNIQAYTIYKTFLLNHFIKFSWCIEMEKNKFTLKGGSFFGNSWNMCNFGRTYFPINWRNEEIYDKRHYFDAKLNEIPSVTM